MPSSVRSILDAADLEPEGSVRWGAPIAAPIPGTTTGVYVVALTADLDEATTMHPTCPLSADALAQLLDARPELRLDGKRPVGAALGERLAAFWLADEPIIYIGRAGPRAKRPREGELAKRVGEYYKTSLGARSPHAGGWPLKTLAVLEELVVHYAYCDGVKKAEQAMLRAFADGVSPDTRKKLHDRERVMPFANLEYPPGVRKEHGITNATAPARSRKGGGPTAAPRAPTKKATSSLVASRETTTGMGLTQNITAGDVASGIIRVPKGTKRFFPRTKSEVRVELRGDDLGACKWDPRTGPDRERSGVLRIGKAAVGRLQLGETLQIERAGKGVRLASGRDVKQASNER